MGANDNGTFKVEERSLTSKGKIQISELGQDQIDAEKTQSLGIYVAIDGIIFKI
jgi:hypothetical protein